MSSNPSSHPKPDAPTRYKRVLSPHLQIWRWHTTMLASILHRASGVGAVGGLILGVAWLVCLALGVEAYTVYTAIAASPFGLAVWFLATLAGFVHLTGGVRHLIWDAGIGFTPHVADRLSMLSYWVALILTVGFWAGLILAGKISL